MRRGLILIAGIAGCMLATAAVGNDWNSNQAYPGLVPTFDAACLSGDLTVPAREAAIAAGGWQQSNAGGIDVDAFQITAALEVNFNFREPDSLRVWTKTVDGASAKLVLATYPSKRRYQTLCGIIMPQSGGAIAYYDQLDALLKSKGIKGKSTDLPHYFEWASKLGPDKNPVRAEILSRSHVLQGTRDIHLYIAF